MKIKSYLIFSILFLFFLFNNLKVSYGNIERVKLSNKGNYIYQNTMYVESDLIGQDIKIKDEYSPIKNISKGVNLYIFFDKDVKKDYKINITLENANWFFRSMESIDTSFGNSKAIEGYKNEEVLKYFRTNYNLRRGVFIPSSQVSQTGTYYRNSFEEEEEYILKIKNSKEADLILKNNIKKGDYVIVPLVTKTEGYKDSNVNIKTEEFNSTLIFTNYNKDNKHEHTINEKTEISINNYAKSTEEFALDNIYIKELYLGAIEEGIFEITAEEGYIITPNIDNIDKNFNRGENILNAKNEDGYVINVSVEGGIEWKNGKYKTGEGERGKDYTVEYSSFGPVLNKNKLIIKIKDINKSKDIKGSIIIKGLRLIKLNSYNNFFNSKDIHLYIKNEKEIGLTKEKKLKVAELLSSKNMYKEEIMEDSIFKENSRWDYININSVPDFINIDNYDINTLIDMVDFHKKGYLKNYENNKIEPDKFITRKEVSEMLYNLLGNKKINYKHPFSDCDENNNAIGFCFNKGYIKGYEDGTFKPEEEITRGEFAKILNNILNIKSNYYTDILPKDHFAYKDVCNLMYKGIISGYPDGEFKENNKITKAEAIVMINKGFNRGSTFKEEIENFYDLNKDHFAYNYIMNAKGGFKEDEE